MKKIRATESSKKCKVDKPIDRLSALPDSLLLHILSFLGVKKAAVTSLLSKRWQFLWTDLPRLNFRESSHEHKKLREFAAWVHRTLNIRSSNCLEKFELQFRYSKRFVSDVNAWVEFCVNNKVKNVVLELYPRKRKYTLPQMMYSNSSLTCLEVSDCIMSPQKTIEWRSLTKLQLQGVELSRHLFENIISGCPVLYDLILEMCWGLDRLEVYSRSLHSLEIIDWKEEIEESLLEISTPYVQSLKISMWGYSQRLRITNISSLVRVDITLSDTWDAESEEDASYAKELFESIQHVKKVELGSYCIQILSVLVMDGWRLPQFRAEYLTVDVSEDEPDISVIVELLESTPNLETLVIEGWYYHQTWVSDDERGSYLEKGDLTCDLFHLKTISITGFADSSVADQSMLLTLVRVLLKRAVVLEKMSINVRGIDMLPTYASGDYMTVAQTLLSYPRSSTKALVLFRC